jgi:hypothetical protein
MAKRPRSNTVENKMARSLDRLAQFERYEEEVGSILRDAIAKGLTAEQMRKHPKIQALMEARKISIALTDPDSSRALAAITDSTNRVEGKAVERKETTHRYEKLKDDELDSLVLSELGELTDDTNNSKH